MRVTITPEKAEELLKNNSNNRRMSHALAKKYAADIREGLWLYNGDPIRVADNGELLDGQHRLQACIYAQMPFETELLEGLPREVRPTIDTGRRRSAADTLHIVHGHSHGNAAVAASARQILNYVCGFAPGQAQSTPAIVRLLRRYPDEIGDACRLAQKTKGVLTAGPLGAVLFIGSRAPGMESRIGRFIEGVATGQDLGEGDPRLALRNAFMNKRTTGARLEQAYCVIAITRAWNAWAMQQGLKIIQVQRDMNGQWTMPDIVGGPPRGEGIDSLDGVGAVTALRRPARFQEEEASMSP